MQPVREIPVAIEELSAIGGAAGLGGLEILGNDRVELSLAPQFAGARRALVCTASEHMGFSSDDRIIGLMSRATREGFSDRV